MALLTKIRMSQLEQVLNASFFTITGYKVKHTPKSVEVRFLDDDANYFTVTSSTQTVGALLCTFAPGDVLAAEAVETRNFEDVVRRLGHWCERVKDDVVSTDPLHRQMEAFRSELEAKMDAHFQDGSTHFTDKERVEMEQRLEELYATVADLLKNDEEHSAELDRLRRVLGELKGSTQSMPKRTWVRTACSKVYDFSLKIISTPAGQKLLNGGVDKLLGTGPSSPSGPSGPG